jgi:hypothetical protein
MTKSISSFAARSALAVCSALVWSACAGEQPVDPAVSGAAGASQISTAGTSATSGDAGAMASGGTTTGGAGASAGSASMPGQIVTAGSGIGGAAGGAAGGGAANAGSGTAGVATSAGSAGTAAGSGGGPVIPPGCMVSNPVSFKADIGPWLNQSCGKGRGGGCHVTDDSSTVNSLCPDGTKKCGFNHAYDWITAGSHNEFCKQTPAPIRYTIVMDVLEKADPPSCTSTRVMPPDGPPATECQKAALAAWLAQPKVLQVHRADDTSPAEAYLMPPFN